MKSKLGEIEFTPVFTLGNTSRGGFGAQEHDRFRFGEGHD
jgi:hypothetical protein